jgi:phosphatidylserine/phosphatidylglycerophosphate/cardiolipin synthase-like enzyme
MKRVVLALVASAAMISCSGGDNTVHEIIVPGDQHPGDGSSSGASGTTPGASSGNPGSSGASGSSGGTTPVPPSTNVKIVVEPGDSGQSLVSAINGATKSVHMTMYLLSSTAVMNALVSAKNKGRDVKVLLNKTFPGGQGSNSSAYSQLQSAGISVAWAPAGYTLTHEKCVIVDGQTAWIMTMNATQSSPTDNREYLAADTDPDDVAEAEAIFAADFANTNPSLTTGKLVVAPTNARARMQALINGAKTSIDIEGEELSDSTLVPLLAAKADAGVKVRIVLSNITPSPAQTTAVATLKTHKVGIVQLASPYVHAKALVADGTLAYVGSANFTASSLTSNRELGVIFSTAAEVAKVSSTIASDFSSGSAL